MDHCSLPLESKPKENAKYIYFIYMHVHPHTHHCHWFYTFSYLCHFPSGLPLPKPKTKVQSATSPSFTHSFADPLQSLLSLPHYHPTTSTSLLLVGVMETLTVWISFAASAPIMASCAISLCIESQCCHTHGIVIDEV